MLLNELIGNEYPACSRTNGISSAKALFKEGTPYTKTKLIDGTDKYVWDEQFVEKVISALETGEIPSLSSKEQQVLDGYISMINNGVTVGTKAEVLALDKKLGEMI